MQTHLDGPGLVFFGAQVRPLSAARAAGPATGPVSSSFRASPEKVASHCSARGSLPEGESKAISIASFSPEAADPEETRTLCPSRGSAERNTLRLRMLLRLYAASKKVAKENYSVPASVTSYGSGSLMTHYPSFARNLPFWKRFRMVCGMAGTVHRIQ